MLNIEEIQRSDWNYLVNGTGVGGHAARAFRAPASHPCHCPTCETIPGCECCLRLSPSHECKKDAGRREPTVRNCGAILLDECEVIGVEGTSDRVTGVANNWHGSAGASSVCTNAIMQGVGYVYIL